MIRLLKYTAIVYFLRRYRRVLIALIALAALFLLVDFVYEAVSHHYTQVKDPAFQAISTTLFWIQLGVKLFIIAVIVLILYLAFRPKKERPKRAAFNDRAREVDDRRFDFLREKKRLSSQADRVIRKKERT